MEISLVINIKLSRSMLGKYSHYSYLDEAATIRQSSWSRGLGLPKKLSLTGWLFVACIVFFFHEDWMIADEQQRKNKTAQVSQLFPRSSLFVSLHSLKGYESFGQPIPNFIKFIYSTVSSIEMKKFSPPKKIANNRTNGMDNFHSSKLQSFLLYSCQLKPTDS